MEDELHHEARIKMHSTTSQALDIGKQMNAKYIILTHFSQRYARVPRIPDDMDNNVGIAFDNMKVSKLTTDFVLGVYRLCWKTFLIENQCYFIFIFSM